jgi:hypothetical protein
MPVISKICPSGRKWPFYLSSVARRIISETGKRKYKIRRIIILPAFIRKYCSEVRCIIDDKTSFSVRDINISFITYAIISALLGKSKANKITYACSIYLTQYLLAFSSFFSKIYMAHLILLSLCAHCHSFVCLINFIQNLCVLISLNSGYKYAYFIWFRVCVCLFYFSLHLCVFSTFSPGFVCAQFILFMIFVCSINFSQDLCVRSLFDKSLCVLNLFARDFCVLVLFCSRIMCALLILLRMYVCSLCFRQGLCVLSSFYSWFMWAQLIFFRTNVCSAHFTHDLCELS